MPKWNGGVIGVANNPTQSSAKGIWSLSEATKAIRAGLWPPSNAGADPYFENVTMLLSADGTNGAQNNTFLDSSTNNFTITRNGNTTQGTFTPFSKPDGRWGNSFDGNGDYLTVPGNTSLEFGTGDFTIEFWVYYNSGLTADVALYDGRPSGTNGVYPLIFSNTTGKLVWYINSAARITGTTTLSVGTWYHVAVARSGTSTKLFINGTQEGSTYTDSNSYLIGTSRPTIGAAGATAGADPLNGYISNLRVVKGTAVYTAAFTPPTAPLTAITNTSLLTCQSNRFRDNSTNAFAITRNGDVSIQTFSPFPTLTAYASGTNGGSGYFDGTGDYLTAPNNTAFDFGSGDWTIETWVYASSLASNLNLFSKRTDPATEYRWVIATILTNGTINIQVTNNGSSWIINTASTSVITAGSWNHVAVVRSGNDVSVYINGVKNTVSTGALGSIYNGTEPVVIGAAGTTGSLVPMNGYLSSFRIVKGTAVYTATFTPPTAPLTAITNTSLLCNFTNGGIIDNTMSNDLETVGNASISTTQSKWGGSSMYFDGNGDYLFVPNTNLSFNFGTGDFTVEGWIYLSATPSTSGTIIDTRSSDALSEYHISITTSNKLDFIYSSSRVTSATSISNTTWTHFAITRSSGTIRLFINGTLDANTASYSSGINAAATPAIGGGRSGGTSAISGYYFNGYIDDLRITKGYARYTASFTAPTAAFNGFGD